MFSRLFAYEQNFIFNDKNQNVKSIYKQHTISLISINLYSCTALFVKYLLCLENDSVKPIMDTLSLIGNAQALRYCEGKSRP